jgi:dihydropteroate synthase
MADDTNTPKETIDEKIARLEKEAKLAKLEKEAAARSRPPLTTRAKEAVTSGVEKTTGAVKKATSFVKEKTGIGVKPKISPVTGRPEVAPSFLEKGISGLADIASVFANKAKTALTATSAEQRLQAQMTPEQILAKKVSDAKRSSALKVQLKEQALTFGKPSSNLDVGPDKKVVIGPRGQQAVVPKSTPNIAVLEPLETRIASYTDRLHNFIKNESPVFTTGMRKTYPATILTASRNKVASMGGSQIAEDFLLAGLNKSGMFTADEVPAVAARLKNRIETRKLLTDSGLFDTIDRPPTRVSGGAPTPIVIKGDTIVPAGANSQPPKDAVKTGTTKTVGGDVPAEQRVGRKGYKPVFQTASGDKANTDVAAILEQRRIAREAQSVADADAFNASLAAKKAAEEARLRALQESIDNSPPPTYAPKEPTIVEQNIRDAKPLTAEQETTYQRVLKQLEEQAARQAGATGKPAPAPQMTPAEQSKYDKGMAKGKGRPVLPSTQSTGKPTNVATPAMAELSAHEQALRNRGGVLGGTQWLRGIGRLGGQALGITPDIMTGYALGVQGSGMTSDGRVLYPHEMTTIDGATYANETLDTIASMHPNNAARYPEVTHAQRYNFYPRWYRDYEDARSQDVAEWVNRTGYVAQPMQGSQPISPEVLNAIRAAR